MYGLRHTFSNMLFEMNENPKVIQQLLGHKDVRTTITVYNSVDQDYLRQSTNKLNDKFNQEIFTTPAQTTPSKEQILTNLQNNDLEEDEDIDEMIKQLEQLKAKKKAKEKDFEM